MLVTLLKIVALMIVASIALGAGETIIGREADKESFWFGFLYAMVIILAYNWLFM